MHLCLNPSCTHTYLWNICHSLTMLRVLHLEKKLLNQNNNPLLEKKKTLHIFFIFY
eukprot:UN10277